MARKAAEAKTSSTTETTEAITKPKAIKKETAKKSVEGQAEETKTPKAAKKVEPKVVKKAVAPKPVSNEKKSITKKSSVLDDIDDAVVVVRKPLGKAEGASMVKTSSKKANAPLKEVKIPKLTTKSSVPYSPGYTPLDKREEAPISSDPMIRYNDSELNEFRDIINKKLEVSKKELGYLQGLISRKDEMGSDNDDNRYMTMEDGTMSMEREQLSQMAGRQISYIDHLEKALMRIENKTYGICRVTGKLIDKARLRAVPHATLSLEAKLGLVK